MGFRGRLDADPGAGEPGDAPDADWVGWAPVAAGTPAGPTAAKVIQPGPKPAGPSHGDWLVVCWLSG